MTAYPEAMQAYTESSVLTAPPERLVVMLYDGAGRFLARAAAAIRDGDARAAGESIRRAHAILDELLATLNQDAGEIAERLESIYLFCKRALTEAQLKRDPEGVERIAGLLAELREAWAQIAGAAAAGAAGAAEGEAASAPSAEGAPSPAPAASPYAAAGAGAAPGPRIEASA